jgi:hypothetical protein
VSLQKWIPSPCQRQFLRLPFLYFCLRVSKFLTRTAHPTYCGVKFCGPSEQDDRW